MVPPRRLWLGGYGSPNFGFPAVRGAGNRKARRCQRQKSAGAGCRGLMWSGQAYPAPDVGGHIQAHRQGALTGQDLQLRRICENYTAEVGNCQPSLTPSLTGVTLAVKWFILRRSAAYAISSTISHPTRMDSSTATANSRYHHHCCVSGVLTSGAAVTGSDGGFVGGLGGGMVG